ncbi:MAG: hypothetical protein A2599_03320 [Candidatus Staskawiczbacteria bacterium RIFOXYD1_FULL_39_28]|uniref:GerMN domain-containing protein n=1 Tax=Candidatus Staskawiczbacteria bacterium RIFOXYC1_FULL_38_18 TaxID=1802229 RepID=A0A1G2JBC7_9BACT|nr:MAG: hypothetical protein A2401_03700 [Candidatus Staskawiczbacteria bacterium RIFOXYC1_FULL_38_18]OGZ90322.1 MAG: hypothetical protein A2599_03320 [Candidatus Staskawiczbacteria bacterium RIFOXYD1_FULL_39_28]
MNKYIWLVIFLAIIIAALGAVLIFLPVKNNINNPPVVLGIRITSPISGAEIFSPLKITGTTNGEGWNGFEGQVGTVKLLDKNGKQLGQTAILTAITDWMKPPVSFETYLAFVSQEEQSGFLVFKNENPSGLPDNEKQFAIPVKIAKSSGELITVKAYFNNSELDSEYSCNKVFPVERQVAKTPAIARTALEELLKGPVNLEKDAGFFTSINTGVKIQKLTIENETAKVDFDEQLQFQVGGSCKVSAIRAQITETLKQFPIVKNVIISIDGRTEDILQP